MADTSVRSRLGRPFLLAGLGLVVAAAATLAGPPARNSADGVIVLRNGRVLAGHIELVESGYEVKSSRGRAVVPRELVDVEGRNLVDAYRKLRARMPDRTATGHIVLARWCLLYGLNQQALAEFREAARLAPGNSTARSMVARLDSSVGSRGTVPTVRVATALMSRAAEPVEALGGLPRELAAMYVRKVQPLLSHRCGNASCHGTSSGRRFRLEPTGRERSGFGVRTRRNLEATLAQIDPVGDSSSPLLDFAGKLHGTAGGRRKPLGLNPQQQRMIESWVQQVLRSRAGTAREASNELKTASSSPGVNRDERRPLQSGGATVDVFDPAAFNRETRRRQSIRQKGAAAAAARRGPRQPRAGG